jgi:hypothetical protein
MSSANTRISLVGASHVCSKYSAQIDVHRVPVPYFHHLAQVMFLVHIQHIHFYRRRAVGRETIQEFLHLARFMFRVPI